MYRLYQCMDNRPGSQHHLLHWRISKQYHTIRHYIRCCECHNLRPVVRSFEVWYRIFQNGQLPLKQQLRKPSKIHIVLIFDGGNISLISPIYTSCNCWSLHLAFLCCFWQVFYFEGLHGHEFVMSQISELVDRHCPCVFTTGMLIIVLVDLGNVGSEDSFFVGLFNTITVLFAMCVLESSELSIKRQVACNSNGNQGKRTQQYLHFDFLMELQLTK